jgi:hypothetical protein
MSDPKIYQCHKQVKAIPMNRQKYNDYRGWDLPDDEDGSDNGYLIECLDGVESNHRDHKGYISWSPKEQFDNGYSDITDGFDFGEAIKQARLGRKVARKGWNGSGMFAYIVPAAKYKAQTSVMLDMAYENNLIPYREYWALFTAQKDVATWAPSCSDSLALDWCVVDV